MAIRLAACPWFFVVLALTTSLAVAQTPHLQAPPATQPRASEAQPEDDAPPPLQLRVSLNGTATSAPAGVPVDVTVAGGNVVRVRVDPLPHRVFERAGVRFHYPAGHAWEVDRDDPDCVIWTMDGSDNVIMVMRHNVPAKDSAVVHAALVGEMVEQYGGRDKARRSRLSTRFGEHELSGTRIDTTLVDSKFRQDVYTFSAHDAVVSLVIQDSPDEQGAATEETRTATELLRRTFELARTTR